MSRRIEAPRSFNFDSQDVSFEGEKKSRRRHFPRARGKGILGQIGKRLIYRPTRWLHEHSPRGEEYLESRLKRGIDIISLLPLSLVGVPIMLSEAAYVSFKDKTWPIYALPCVGQNGKIFGRLKIKTMIEGADEMPGFEVPMLIKSPEDPRITHPSLRRTSIDELPQIINIVKGEMSVVGPVGRPKSEIDYFEEVITWQPGLKGRIEKFLELYPRAKPGMTGPYQTMGRANLTLRESSIIEGWYLKNASWVVDLNIILGTPLMIISGEGAY